MDIKGKVFWVTGLSGAGKTTLGGMLHKHLQAQNPKLPRAVLLDGDSLREVFGGHFGHTIEERKKLAMTYARLCRLLSSQGIDVVCCTISMFHDVRKWNRENIDGYSEIYLKVPIETLVERDQKQLYSRALKGQETNVMGLNCPFEEPQQPDLTLSNDGQLPADEVFDLLVRELERTRCL